ncbi:hypothetical protein RCL1_004841 [Eukaryota sp. TZLM3-RCL]
MTTVIRDLVRNLIDRFLGDYIYGLNPEDLKLSVLSGDVVLKDLVIRPDALSKFHPFLAVRRGSLGSLEIKLSWTKLTKKPVVVNIKNVYLLVTPKTSEEFSENSAEAAQKKIADEKKQRLEAYENSRSQAIKSNGNEKEEEKPGKIAALATHIISNLQVNFSNFHIRFENNLSPNPIAFGVKLDGLSISSTGPDFTTDLLNTSLDHFYKLLQIQGLSVYGDVPSTPLGSNPTPNPTPHDYIIKPFNFHLQLAINKNAGNTDNWSQPKIKANLCVNSAKEGCSASHLGLSISSYQLKSIINVGEFLGRYSTLSKYLHIRPGVTPSQSPRAWWVYAITAVREELRASKNAAPLITNDRSWDATLLSEYVILFKRSRNVSFLASLSSSETSRLAELESEFDVDTLLKLRVEADKQLSEEILKRESESGGRLSRAQIKDRKSALLSHEQQEELYQDLGVPPGGDSFGLKLIPSSRKYSYAHTSVSFDLSGISLDLVDENIKIIQICLQGMSSKLRVMTGCIGFEFLLENFVVSVPGNSEIYRQIITKSSTSAPSSALLSCSITSYNQSFLIDDGRKMDLNVDVRTEPLDILADLRTILTLQTLFAPPSSASTSSSLLDVPVYSSLYDVVQQSEKVKNVLQNRPAMFVKMNLAAPNVKILYKLLDPEYSGGNFDGLEIVLGKLLIDLIPQVKPTTPLLTDTTTIYDSVDLKFQDLSVTLTSKNLNQNILSGIGIKGSAFLNVNSQDLLNPMVALSLSFTGNPLSSGVEKAPVILNISEQSIYDLIGLANSLQSIMTEFNPPQEGQPPSTPMASINMSQEIVTVDTISSKGALEISSTASKILDQAQLLVSINFDGLIISLSAPDPLLSLNLSSISSMIQKSREGISFSLGLLGLSISAPSPYPLSLISVTGDLEFVNRLLLRDPIAESPDKFAIVLEGFLHSPSYDLHGSELQNGHLEVKSQVADIIMRFDPQIVSDLLVAVKRIQTNSMNLLPSSSSSSSSPSSPSSSSEVQGSQGCRGIEVESSQSQTEVIAESGKKSGINISGTFSMNSVSVILNKFTDEILPSEQLFFSSATFSNFLLDFSHSPSSSDVTASLATITVSHCCSESWPFMVKSLVKEGEAIFRVGVKLRTPFETSSINLDFSDIELVVLGPFILAMMKYLNCLSHLFSSISDSNNGNYTPEDRLSSSSSHSSSSQPSSSSPLSHLALPHVVCSITNFHVVIPRRSELSRPHCVELIVGNFYVTTLNNNVTENLDENSAIIGSKNSIEVCFSELSVFSGTHLLKDAHLVLNITTYQNFDGQEVSGPIDCEVKLGTDGKKSIDLNINKSIIEVAMDTMNYNMKYIAQISDLSEPKSSEVRQPRQQTSSQSESAIETTAKQTDFNLKFSIVLPALLITLENEILSSNIGRFELFNLSLIGTASKLSSSLSSSLIFSLDSIKILDLRSLSPPWMSTIAAVQDYSEDHLGKAVEIGVDFVEKSLSIDANLAGFYCIIVPDFLIDVALFLKEATSITAPCEEYPRIYTEKIERGEQDEASKTQNQGEENQQDQVKESFINDVALALRGRLDFIVPDNCHFCPSPPSSYSALALSVAFETEYSARSEKETSSSAVKLILDPFSFVAPFSLTSLDVSYLEIPAEIPDVTVLLRSIASRVSPSVGLIRAILKQLRFSSMVSYTPLATCSDQKGGNIATVHGVLSPLVLSLAFLDLRLSWNVVNNFMTVFAEQSARLSVVNEERSCREEEGEVGISKETNREEENGTSSTSLLSLDVSLNVPEISILFLDDSRSKSGLPLCKLSISMPSSLHFTKLNNKIDSSCLLHMEAHLWNDLVSNYDVFIEPFDVDVIVGSTPALEGKQMVSAACHVVPGFDVTLTDGSLCTLASMIPLISTCAVESRLTQSTVHQEYCPVWIVNYSGYLVEVSTSVPTSTLESSCVRGDPVASLIDHNARRGISVNSRTPITITIRGHQVYTFNYDDFNCPVVVNCPSIGDVMLTPDKQERSTFVFVSGTTVVLNQTDADFYLYPCDNVRILSRTSSLVYLPVSYYGDQWSLKPCITTENSVEIYSSSQLLSHTQSTVAMCKTETDLTTLQLTGPAPAFFKVACNHCPFFQTTTISVGNSFTLTPPVVLTNTLPYPLAIKLSHKSNVVCTDKLVFSTTLAPLEIFPVYHYDLASPLYAVLRILDTTSMDDSEPLYEWSREVRLADTAGFTSKNVPSHVPLKISGTRGGVIASTVDLMLEYCNNDDKILKYHENFPVTTFEVKFWIPLLVFNHSKWPIAIHPTKNTHKPIIDTICRCSSNPILICDSGLAEKLSSKSDVLPKIRLALPESKPSSDLTPLPSASQTTEVCRGNAVYHFAISSPTPSAVVGESFIRGAKNQIASKVVPLCKVATPKGLMCSVSDRFVFRNTLSCSITIDVAADMVKGLCSQPTIVPAESSEPLNPHTVVSHRNIPQKSCGYVTLTLENYYPSAPFSIFEAAEFTIETVPVSPSMPSQLVNVFVDPGQAQVYVTITRASTSHPPIRLVNCSTRSIEVKQILSKSDPLFDCSSALQASLSTVFTLAPLQSKPFAFPVPSAPNTLEIKLAMGNGDASPLIVGKNRLGIFVPSKDTTRGIIANVELDGPCRVVTIHDVYSECGQILYQQFTNGKVCKRNRRQRYSALIDTAGFTVDFKLPVAGISLVDCYPREVLYFGMRCMSVVFGSAESVAALELTIDSIQLLDQSSQPQFPIVFGISRVSDVAAAATNGFKPAVDFRVQINNSHQGVVAFDDISLLVQPITVSISDQFILALLRSFNVFKDPLVTSMVGSLPPQDPCELARQLAPVPPPVLSANQSARIFIGRLDLEPLKITISSNLTPALFGTGPRIGRTLISTAGSLSNCALKFPSLVIENVFEIPTIILNRVVNHYKSAAIREWYKILGASDAIGAPYALFAHLGTGFHELWYDLFPLSLLTSCTNLTKVFYLILP